MICAARRQAAHRMGEQTTVTTAGDNGVPEGQGGGAPQDDDPFGYLYRPADGSTGQPAEPQQGVPRTPYSRPMEVGRAQYGQHYQQGGPPRQQPPYGQPGMPPQGPYGQQGAPQQAPYGQPGMPPQGEYGAPAQQARYAEHSRPQPGEEERQSSGRSRGAVIGAVAVVAAIAIGAGIALSSNGPDDGKDAKGGTTTAAPPAPTTPVASASAGTASPTATATVGSGPTTVDANQLQGQNAPSGNSVKGAKSADGGYLTLQQGGSVTWTGEVAAAGTYKLSVHYNNAGGDVKGAASVNGKDWPSGVSYGNYNKGAKDPSSQWFNTYILPQLQAGQNSVTLMPAAGTTLLIDQITIEPS